MKPSVLKPVALVAVFATVGCGGLAKRMKVATNAKCSELLAGHPAIAGDPDYGGQSHQRRSEYEAAVAECEIHEGSPAKAIEMAEQWTEDPETAARVKLSALIKMGDDAGARAAIEELVDRPGFGPEFFVETRALERFVGQPWFVELALRTWRRRPEGAFDMFAMRVAGATPKDLLSLSLADADEDQPRGRWALWTGIVRDARIDRSSETTLLFVEGVDVAEVLTSKEHVVTSTETKFKGAWGSYRAETRATDSHVEKSYQEDFKPNGRMFTVRVKGVKPKLVELRTVQAFGRFVGRSGDDSRPTIDAVMVVERKARARDTVER